MRHEPGSGDGVGGGLSEGPLAAGLAVGSSSTRPGLPEAVPPGAGTVMGLVEDSWVGSSRVMPSASGSAVLSGPAEEPPGGGSADAGEMGGVLAS